MPLCHTAAVGAHSICWWLGAPLILSPKFSASTFWRECHEHKATVVQAAAALDTQVTRAVHNPVMHTPAMHKPLALRIA